MSSPTIQPYKHLPLPAGRCIRLIHVQPSPVTASDLVCDLDDANLDQNPTYEALSYAWEGQTPSVPILCRTGPYQGSLLITANCAAALRELRRGSEEFAVWIDSICIDQTSIDERSSQVALMGPIYKAANRIVVWLGDRDERVVAALQLLTQISSLAHASGDQPREALYSKVRELTRGVSNDSQDILHPLFQRPWFSRMWTVQEIVLNYKGLVNCGGVTLPWTDLLVAVDVLNRTGYQYGGWQTVLALHKYLALALMLHQYPQARDIINKNNLRDDIADIDNDFDIFRTFHYAREKKASDPKDKIYALQAVLDEFGVNLPAPDYRKSVREIYSEATLKLIEHDQSLVVLHFVSSHNRGVGFPSWVPDFTDPTFREDDPRFPLTRSRFGAGGPLEAQWESRLGGLQLLVRGKMIDKVMYRGQGLPFINPRGMNFKELLKLDDSGQLTMTEGLRSLQQATRIFQEWCDVGLWSDSYPNGETTKDALRAALLNDFPRNMNDSKCMTAFEPWFQYMTASSEKHQPGGSIQISTEFNRIAALYSGPGMPFHGSAMAFCHHKTLYRTENGWLGMAPDFMPDPIQSGDMIATIRGMAMPVVLRQSDTTGGYQLISHCYLHGWMYGEGWDDESQIPETSILLV